MFSILFTQKITCNIKFIYSIHHWSPKLYYNSYIISKVSYLCQRGHQGLLSTWWETMLGKLYTGYDYFFLCLFQLSDVYWTLILFCDYMNKSIRLYFSLFVILHYMFKMLWNMIHVNLGSLRLSLLCFKD